jgi:hypothetical protein
MALETEREGSKVDGILCNQIPAKVGIYYFIRRTSLLSNRMHGFRIIRPQYLSEKHIFGRNQIRS